MRSVNPQRMLKRFKKNDNDDETPLHYTTGPFLPPQAFYQHAVDREEPPTNHLHQEIQKLLQLILDSILGVQAKTPFILYLPGLNFQNIIVSLHDRLQGLVGCDGATAVPCSVGNKPLPSFLIWDRDPAIYAWHEEM